MHYVLIVDSPTLTPPRSSTPTTGKYHCKENLYPVIIAFSIFETINLTKGINCQPMELKMCYLSRMGHMGQEFGVDACCGEMGNNYLRRRDYLAGKTPDPVQKMRD